jgi:hypothetical protein
MVWCLINQAQGQLYLYLYHSLVYPARILNFSIFISPLITIVMFPHTHTSTQHQFCLYIKEYMLITGYSQVPQGCVVLYRIITTVFSCNDSRNSGLMFGNPKQNIIMLISHIHIPNRIRETLPHVGFSISILFASNTRIPCHQCVF